MSPGDPTVTTARTGLPSGPARHTVGPQITSLGLTGWWGQEAEKEAGGRRGAGGQPAGAPDSLPGLAPFARKFAERRESVPLPWQPLCHSVRGWQCKEACLKGAGRTAHQLAGSPNSGSPESPHNSGRGAQWGCPRTLHQLKSKAVPDGSVPPGPRPSTARGLRNGVRAGPDPPLHGATALRTFRVPQLGNAAGERGAGRGSAWSAGRRGGVTGLRPPKGVNGSGELRGAPLAAREGAPNPPSPEPGPTARGVSSQGGTCT